MPAPLQVNAGGVDRQGEGVCRSQSWCGTVAGLMHQNAASWMLRGRFVLPGFRDFTFLPQTNHYLLNIVCLVSVFIVCCFADASLDGLFSDRGERKELNKKFKTIIWVSLCVGGKI